VTTGATPARTTSGPVVGGRQAGARVWRGVPYGRAGRFAPARPAPSWTAPRPCLHPGPVAPQPAAGGAVVGDEDGCLVLDVHRPDGPAEGLPVLVFVHGGAFLGGGAPDYDGAVLAVRCSAVVVVVQYRLGVLGFLSGPGPAPALTDLVLALRWVADNAERFGGDPARTTLAGQSAGAVLACALATTDEVRPLVRRVLALSGAVATATPAAAARTAADLRRLLGGRDPRDAEAADLVAAGPALLAAAAPGEPAAHPLRPVVDGELLARPVEEAVAAGALRDLELWAGTCRDEGAFFLPDAAPAAQAELTERAWRRPAADLVAAHVRAGGRGWLSRFDHVPDLAPFSRLGATHGADNACLWAHPPRFPDRPLLGRAGGPMSAADTAVTDALHDAVRSFVHGEGPGWPGWTPAVPGPRLIGGRA
jgi:para-nitrobenzyl esterase